MHATQVLFAAIAATGAFAAPAAAEVKSMAAAAPQWTVQNTRRVCVDNNAKCTWTFAVNRNNGTPATGCTYVVNRDGNIPSYQAKGGPVQCGAYTITSQWSNQFGSAPKDAFTTLSVVDKKAGLIIYPAYTDLQLSKAQTVKPDQSYPPQGLP